MTGSRVQGPTNRRRRSARLDVAAVRCGHPMPRGHSELHVRSWWTRRRGSEASDGCVCVADPRGTDIRLRATGRDRYENLDGVARSARCAACRRRVVGPGPTACFRGRRALSAAVGRTEHASREVVRVEWFWAIFGVVVWVLLAFWPARVARRKGHSFIGFFIFSLFFWPAALIVAYLVHDRRVAGFA